MPETAAGRPRIHEAHVCRYCGVRIDEAEARALGRAEALAAVRAAVEGLPRTSQTDLIVRTSVLAAIDNLETPHG